MRSLIFIILFSLTSSLFAADIPALKKLFKENFNNFFEHRLCGQNTSRFAKAAYDEGIDLSNSYVLKFKGAGFFDTSGFYTRTSTTERSMLGYFHVVFVADGHVFDFDLHEPLVLKMEDYVRLQFTPEKSTKIFNVLYDGKKDLPWWEVTRFEWSEYMRGREIPTWKKKLGELIDIDRTMKKKTQTIKCNQLLKAI